MIGSKGGTTLDGTVGMCMEPSGRGSGKLETDEREKSSVAIAWVVQGCVDWCGARWPRTLGSFDISTNKLSGPVS